MSVEERQNQNTVSREGGRDGVAHHGSGWPAAADGWPQQLGSVMTWLNNSDEHESLIPRASHVTDMRKGVRRNTSTCELSAVLVARET